MSMSGSPSPTENTSPALSAFDALRAEDESWLETCFVPPPDFELIAGARSMLVLGEPGSGKTALYRMLLLRLRPPDRKPHRLIVEWRPQSLPPGTPANSATAEVMLDRVLSECTAELVRHLTAWPGKFEAAPEDVKNTLAWFARRYPPSERIPDWLARSAQDDFLDGAVPQHRIAELVKALAEIELAGACVLVGPDHLEGWETVQLGLGALLSSLNLFEQTRFVYKFVLPAAQGSSLLTTSGVERRRLDTMPLRWFEPELITIVERRLAFATGGKASRLSDVCEDEKVSEWLARCSGNVPRDWLEQTRPLASHYLSRGRPLTVTEWKEIRNSRPPRLSVDLETGRVMVGQKELEGIGPVGMALLSYLYQHRDRICTRDELYHKAYLPAVYPDQPEQRAETIEYKDLLNNVLYRLREAIEPDPRQPVFIVAKPRKGVQLENAW